MVRIAAGDSSAMAKGRELTAAEPAELAEAAAFYLQQLLFAPGTDSYRVLGVNPGADDARIKEHYRWLVRWLHPDRNADDWDTIYTDRVTRAWQQLRRSGALAGEGETEGELPERRAQPRPEPVPAAPSVLAATRLAHISREQPAAAPILSARTARQLPAFVLGGLGLIAVSLVALLWYAQQNPRPPPAPRGGP